MRAIVWTPLIYIMFLCHVASYGRFIQIMFYSLMHYCHIWRGRSIRPESAGSEDDLLTVNVSCMTV